MAWSRRREQRGSGLAFGIQTLRYEALAIACDIR